MNSKPPKLLSMDIAMSGIFTECKASRKLKGEGLFYLNESATGLSIGI
jgi:hypothetical protein